MRYAPATNQYRAQILIWLIRTYASPAEWILESESASAAAEFKAIAIAAAENSDLSRALDGEFG